MYEVNGTICIINIAQRSISTWGLLSAGPFGSAVGFIVDLVVDLATFVRFLFLGSISIFWIRNSN